MSKWMLVILIGLPFINVQAKSKKKLDSIPLAEMFWSLFQEKNVLGHNDCTNKCGRYLRALVEKGHTAEIVIVMPDKARYQHAIIKLNDSENNLYLDPTRGIVSRSLKGFGSFKKAIKYGQLAQLGADYK